MQDWGVIFDMDGVLIDSYQAHFESWRAMLQNHGLDMTEDQFAATFGQTSRGILNTHYPSVTPAEIPALDAEKEAAYRKIITADFPEMDGADELISALHSAGAKLAIGSSGPPGNIAAVMKVLPNADKISAVTNGHEVEHGKPAPDVFIKAAEKLNLPPQRCIVIEDAPAGVQAGKAAGCAVVGLTGTVEAEGLQQADLIVESLRELTPEKIEGLL